MADPSPPLTPVTGHPTPTAPHAPLVHLLAGPGAGPGIRPWNGAGSQHSADADLHAGGLHLGRWAGQGCCGVLTHGSVSPQPLTLRRLEHERRRKEIKESWHRAQRKLVGTMWAEGAAALPVHPHWAPESPGLDPKIKGREDSMHWHPMVMRC